MGSHFHDRIEGGAFSIELLEWGRTFLVFWGLRQFFTFTVSKCTVGEKWFNSCFRMTYLTD